MDKLTIKSTTISKADAARWGFTTMASVDNPKASKAFDYGYLNGILYMAPADSAGEFNLCPFAGSCKALCLGMESGQAQIRKEGEDNSTTLARKARAKAYMAEREAFLRYVVIDITRLRRIARQLSLKLCYRFNGSTDVGVPRWLLEMFPDVTFIDYTKNPNKMSQYLQGKFPANYHVTFSYDAGTATVPSNEMLARRFLAMGGNVAVVFGNGAPAEWRGHKVVSGDAHDIRIPELDGKGVVIGLTPKGNKAKRDTSGFVVREAA
jgi:hypothetical protein